MTIKKNFSIVIMNPEMIDNINKIIIEYATITMNSSSHMYFDRQPIDPNNIASDITFFQLNAENDLRINKRLNEMIEKLDKLNTDYYIRDEETQRLMVEIKFAGELYVKFDDIPIIKQGTYDRIDSLKLLKNEYGYCKGFKPSFRPVESKPTEDVFVNPEIIYLFSDSSENLSKLRNYLSEKIKEIDTDFELEFIPY